MPFRRGTDDPDRNNWEARIRSAARYAVRASTMNGAEDDFDPDAMVGNMVIGMLGYNTPDALSSDPDFDPKPVPGPWPDVPCLRENSPYITAEDRR